MNADKVSGIEEVKDARHEIANLRFEVSNRKQLEKRRTSGDIPHMVTLKADDRSRVKLPGIKPGQVFAFEDQGNGVRVLTEVKKNVKEPFPKGSLRHLF